jgi:excisionase family DNA binding protein
MAVDRKGSVVGSSGGPVGSEGLLTPAEVAELFRVDPKTVTRWARAGLLDAIRTLGGHRPYRRAEVIALLAKLTEEHRS